MRCKPPQQLFALDQKRVMDFTGLPFEDIKTLHMSKSYYVYLIGFLPGFPYLGELDAKLIFLTASKSLCGCSGSLNEVKKTPFGTTPHAAKD